MSTLRVLFWNVYIGHKPESVKEQLIKMIDTYNPDVIGLAEARGIYSITDDIPGYRRIHNSPGKGPGDEDANICILVRKDVRILKRTNWRMVLNWIGPKHGIPHEPRLYYSLYLKDGRTKWRVSVAHWPFGKAQEETKRKVKRWFRIAPTAASVHAGDLNASKAELDKYYQGMKIRQVGFGIDRALYKNCTARARNLGKRGSDHPAVLFTFRKK